MPWTPRQRAMLQEMGVRIWAPEADSPAETQSATPDALPGSRQTPVGETPPGPENWPVEIAKTLIATPTDLQIGERPGRIATMDWPELREAVAACSACELCRSRTNTVFGCGNPRAQWMIIGEAPGEQEDLRGEPFVGKSGQLLDSMLRAIGLTRDEDSPARQVYIANTLKCRPPANRNPDPAELARCEPFLIRQIELVQPCIILAMGRYAVQALLRSSEPVGRLRGRVHSYQGLPLVVTYHPAYLLRNPQEKARAWADLCLALDVAERSRGL